MLELKGIRRSYNLGAAAQIEILHGIDLVLNRGEFLALMGPSGSGKSTLLNIIGLLDRPTAGQVIIAGEDTSLLGDAAITRMRGHAIGFVFQEHHLISAFTAAENVMLPMEFSGISKAERKKRAAELLNQVGLDTDKQERKPGRLSVSISFWWAAAMPMSRC